MEKINEGVDSSSIVSFSHVPVRLHNKEQILLSLRNLLYYPSVCSSNRVSATYQKLIGAIEQDATRCDFHYDYKTNTLTSCFGVVCGDAYISLMNLRTTLLPVENSSMPGGSMYFNFGPIQTDFNSSFDSGSIDSGFYDKALYKPNSISFFGDALVSLRQLFASGFLYTLYDTPLLHETIALHVPKTGTVDQTKRSLRDIFNESPSLQGAYSRGGSRYYKYGVQTMGAYRQAVYNEQQLVEQVQKCVRKNTVSLCCGTNYELDSKIVKKILTWQKVLFAVGPALGIGSVQCISTALAKSVDFTPFYMVAYLWSFALYHMLPMFQKIAYLGIDTDKNSTAYIADNLEENSRFNSIHPITADIFDFLSGETGERLHHLSGQKTFSLLGGTYGNFTHKQRALLARLLGEAMGGKDNVIITFFKQPTTREQKEQHIALYDTPYQRIWTSDYLHDLGFSVGSFTLKFIYNDTTDAVETYMCMQSTEILDGENSSQTYKQGQEYLIHSSARLSLEDIEQDFGYAFTLEEYKYSSDALQGVAVLKKR